jgi:cyclopropane-fatty-acyl-phospholipid synthase
VAVDGMYACEATGAARRRLAEAAATDWAAFLQARAVELRPGGALLVQCVGTAVDADGTEHVTARELLAAMWEVARGMAADGLLYPDVVDAYTFGVYPRTAEEASAPLDDPALGLAAEEVSVAPVANPYLAELERTGDVAAYGRDYVAFVRGFT